MSELLLELFSEEIPARMQARAAEDLRRLVTEGLKAAGLPTGEARSYATPRRLTLVIEQVPAGSAAVSEDKKGPRVGAPEAAIQGFLKGAGLTSIDEATIVKDAKKGDFYTAVIKKPGRPAAEIIAGVVADTISQFPWPKSMRWGSSSIVWVRPLHSILCLLGAKVVPLVVGGIEASDTTEGHRFLSPGRFKVKNFADYEKKLAAAHVLIDPAVRARMIGDQARAIAKANKLELVEDDGLLAENAGLTEWPTVMMGTFDEAFLAVPPECLITAMRAHQKCFSLREPKAGKLAPRFLAVANLNPRDNGEAIIDGNQKVMRARLADAKFFWDQDLKRRLEPMHFELKGITFHEKLGTQWDRMERTTELSRQIAGSVDAEPELAGRAAQLCKADLVSGMVGEFPELQGLMGRYLAEAEHMDPRIARAIELHYKPKGPTDTVPKEEEGDATAIAVALADKLDTLVGFWAINEKPTGSGDPYQLRRAALGVIRIVIENDLRLPLLPAIQKHYSERLSKPTATLSPTEVLVRGVDSHALALDLLGFFADRLKVYMRDQGARHDLIDAVFALGGQDDLALDRQAGQRAGRIPEDRRRRQPAGWRQAGGEHSRHRGEKGQVELCRRLRFEAADGAGGTEARSRDRGGETGYDRCDQRREFRRRDARAGRVARARRRLLRQGDGQ